MVCQICLSVICFFIFVFRNTNLWNLKTQITMIETQIIVKIEKFETSNVCFDRKQICGFFLISVQISPSDAIEASHLRHLSTSFQCCGDRRTCVLLRGFLVEHWHVYYWHTSVDPVSDSWDCRAIKIFVDFVDRRTRSLPQAIFGNTLGLASSNCQRQTCCRFRQSCTHEAQPV